MQHSLAAVAAATGNKEKLKGWRNASPAAKHLPSAASQQGSASGVFIVLPSLASAVVLICLLASTVRLAAQTASSKTAEIREHLQQAQIALKENQPDAATAELRAVLALDPNNADALANLGIIGFLRGDCQGASQDFRRALAIRPGIAQAKVFLGVCEIRAGNHAGADLLQSAYSGLTDKKLRAEAGLELAGFYYREGDLGRASALAQSLVDLDPDNVNVLYLAQRIYTEMASGIVNKMAVEAPGSARMQQVIAERLVNEGDAPGAVDHYKKALEIDPHLAGVHFELGEAILQASSADAQARAEAEKEIETARAMEGDSPGIECQLGRIALLRSDAGQAYAHYNRAFRLNPGSSDAQLGLGSALMKMQKPEAALKYLRMAVESDPLNSEAHYQLAIAYRDLQMTDDAQKEMRLFQEIKQTMDQVRTLYRQMNRQTKSPGTVAPEAP